MVAMAQGRWLDSLARHQVAAVFVAVLTAAAIGAIRVQLCGAALS
jgi:hypothetical protein